MSLKFEREIDWFCGRMKKKMSNPKNLTKTHWSTIPVKVLLDYLQEEVRELQEAAELGTPRQVLSECCDVANFVMMIADNVWDRGTNHKEKT